MLSGSFQKMSSADKSRERSYILFPTMGLRSYVVRQGLTIRGPADLLSTLRRTCPFFAFLAKCLSLIREGLSSSSPNSTTGSDEKKANKKTEEIL